MKVKIEEGLFIEMDSMQFIVKQYSGETDKWGKALAYYPSLAGCLKFIVTLKVKQSEAVTLCELLEDIKRIEQYIYSLVNNQVSPQGV